VVPDYIAGRDPKSHRMNLVTGATGIVGSHVVAELLALGKPVRVLYRQASSLEHLWSVLRHYGLEREVQRVERLQGDVLDVGSLAEAMHGVQHVYHCAALVSFASKDRRDLLRTNVLGTAQVVDAALQAGVFRFVHVSSTAAIGPVPVGHVADERTPWDANARLSGYAESKYLAELEVYRGLAEGLRAVMVNPAVVLGPGNNGRSSDAIVKRLARGTGWYPPGTNGFVDARDVARAMHLLCEADRVGERFLLAAHNLAYKELFARMAYALHARLPTREVRPWMMQLGWRLEAARTLFGGKPLVTRATARTACAQRRYAGEKIIEATAMAYRSLEDTLSNLAAFQGRTR
jgi:dihydroflavonol-4-reductase